MKLIDIAEFYSDQGGGVKTYIRQKIEAGRRLGHEVAIIAPGPADKIEERHGGRIIWVKAPRLILDPRYHIFTRAAPIHQILDAERPDMVEGSSPWMGGQAAAKWRGDAAKAFFIHQDPVAAYPHVFLGCWLGPDCIDRMFGWFWRYLCKLSGAYDDTVVSGDWLADRLAGFGLRRPTAIPFGIDKRAFSPDYADPALRREMLAACGCAYEDTPLILAVSRHHPEKHVGTMIDAFRIASQTRPMAFYIVGDGPLRRWVERKARKVPHVHVAGAVARERLSRMMASADAMLHGCGLETYGLVIAEALCSGLPLIVPDSGGAADLATPASAETYPAGKAEPGARAILRLLTRDRADLRGGCAAAAARITSPDAHFEKLFTHYEALIARRRASKSR